MAENIRKERTRINPLEALYGAEIYEKAMLAIENRFDPTQPMPEEPEWKFFIHDGEDEYGMGLKGSIIELYGMSKTRKSTLMAMFAAAILSNEKRVENISTTIDGPVIWIDTEQGEDEFAYFQHMVFRLAKKRRNKQSNRYFAINLRPFSEEERLMILDLLILKFTKLGALFIDGIADLSANSNEIQSTKQLVTQVTQWADKHGCPVFTAIHSNKDGKTSTGTLGGYLDKKASVVINTEINSDEGPTTVVCKMVRRGKRFPAFQFMHSPDTGLPEIIDTKNIFGDGTFGEGED